MESKSYKNYLEDLEATDANKWNDATKYYQAGVVFAMYLCKAITESEYLDLRARIPLTLEERQKVNFHV